MKNSILLLGIMSCIVLSGSAQKGGLLVTKYKNQKSNFIKENSKIRIKSDGRTFKGKFNALSDSTILVQADTILLSQISEIRFKKIASQIGGGLLLLTGTYFTAGGIFGVATLAAEGGAEGLLIGLLVLSPLYVGGALIATTGAFILFRGKKYSSANWKYKIVRPVPVKNIS